MHLVFFQNLLWVSSCLLLGVLASTLHIKRSHRTAPIFTAWIDVVLIQELGLSLASTLCSAKAYAVAYWAASSFEVLLQLLLVYEFADKAFRHKNTWVSGTRVPYWICSAFSLLLSIAFMLFATPAARLSKDVYFTRFELMSSLLIFLLCVSTLGFAYRLGAVWKKQDFVRFSGFLLWSMLSTGTDAMHVYERTAGYFSELEVIRSVINHLVVIYWVTTLLHPSSARMGTDDQSQNALAELYRSSQRIEPDPGR